jgi:uncharacterized damage-inducible protein DinB
MSSNAAQELSTRVSRSLEAEYTTIRDKVRRLVQDLSTEDLWRRPYPYGNSVGHLLLHLTGNLSYYIGTQIAGTGYVRNRPLEFSDTSQRPKDEVARAFDDAVAMVATTLANQTPDDWGRPYEAVGTSVPDRLAIFVHCAAHADHHVGQILYLCKQLTIARA